MSLKIKFFMVLALFSSRLLSLDELPRITLYPWENYSHSQDNPLNEIMVSVELNTIKKDFLFTVDEVIETIDPTQRLIIKTTLAKLLSELSLPSSASSSPTPPYGVKVFRHMLLLMYLQTGRSTLDQELMALLDGLRTSQSHNLKSDFLKAKKNLQSYGSRHKNDDVDETSNTIPLINLIRKHDPTMLNGRLSVLELAMHDNAERFAYAVTAESLYSRHKGYNILHYWGIGGNVEIFYTVLTHTSSELRKAFLHQGDDDRGFTPVLFAVFKGRRKQARLLSYLDDGSGFYTTSRYGENILHAWTYTADLDMLDFIFDFAGENIHMLLEQVAGHEQLTPLALAKRQQKGTSILLLQKMKECGININ